MPLVRLEVRQGRSPTQKRAFLQATHDALVEALRIPQGGRTASELDLGFEVQI
jgi:hypothetical protein